MFCLSKSSTHDDRQSETRKERADRGAPDRGGSLMKNMAAGKPARKLWKSVFYLKNYLKLKIYNFRFDHNFIRIKNWKKKFSSNLRPLIYCHFNYKAFANNGVEINIRFEFGLPALLSLPTHQTRSIVRRVFIVSVRFRCSAFAVLTICPSFYYGQWPTGHRPAIVRISVSRGQWGVRPWYSSRILDSGSLVPVAHRSLSFISKFNNFKF